MPLRSRLLSAGIMIFLATSIATAGGAWLKERGSGYAKLGFTTLGANAYYQFDGTQTDSLGKISTQTIQLYGEFGIADDIVAIVDIPVWKFNTVENFETVSGIGDPLMGFKTSILKGDWPVSGGILVGLPLGDPEGLTFNEDSTAFRNLPTGDGELNAWVFAAVSHSFWPKPFYVSFEAGYNFRSIALREFTARPEFDGGNFTNTYFVQLEGGYEPLEHLWIIARMRRLAPAGTPVEGRYAFFGLGEGVTYNAYFLGGVYTLDNGLGFSFDFSSAFGVKNIYAGANLVMGVSYEW